EAEEGLEEDRGGDGEGDLDDDRAEGVGEDVAEQHGEVARARHPRRLHDLALAQGERLAADQPRDVHPASQREGDHDHEDASWDQVQGVGENEDQDQRHQEVGDPVPDVDEERDHGVDLAAIEAGDQTQRDPDQTDDHRAADTDLDSDQGATHDPAEDVAPSLVQTEQVLRTRRLVGGAHGLQPGRVGRPHDRDQGHEQEQYDDRAADQGQPVAADPAPGVRERGDLLGDLVSQL